MHIIGLLAENYKRLRVVEINPKGRVVQITGKNGQGKTSVLDAIWAALVGSRGIAEKPVRKGAEKAKIKLNLGEFTITRSIAPTGTHTLKVENAKGTAVASPQAVLDELLGALTFDPLAFVAMKPKEQVEMLRQVAKVEIDIDAMNKENDHDYAERTLINRDIKRLEVEVAAIEIQEGLPKEKINEKEILEQLNAASDNNMAAADKQRKKFELKAARDKAQDAVYGMLKTLENNAVAISEAEQHLAQLRANHESYTEMRDELVTKGLAADKAWQKAPDPIFTDVSELTEVLQRVQLVNREIDKRARRAGVQAQLDTKRKEADSLTRAMEGRQEQKREAIQNAQMPVAGLTFDENEVMFNSIPLDQLGEAEQIRISTSIAMAANPKLRILRILHGEALDDDSLKILAEMAEQNDFQIWMAKVDSSGKVGIVMEDGMVKAEAE